MVPVLIHFYFNLTLPVRTTKARVNCKKNIDHDLLITKSHMLHENMR